MPELFYTNPRLISDVDVARGGCRAADRQDGRMKYWQMNGPGLERALKKLGLSPRPPRTT